MKNIAIVISFLFLFSCKKEEAAPVTSAPAPRPMLFNYNISGFIPNGTQTVNFKDSYGETMSFKDVAIIDSSSIYVNNVLSLRETYGYHREFKTGDKLRFYFSGNRDTTKKECTFNIWQDKNEQPIVITFKSPSKIIQGEYIIP